MMKKNTCISMINIIQILSFKTIIIHMVLEPMPKFRVQRTKYKITGTISDLSKNGIN